MSPLAGVWCGLLGVPVGAFLNVVVERTPDRVPLRGLVEGEASPPHAWLGVPVQPWLLRGRRPDAGERRTRWLVVELLTAAAFLLVGLRFGETTVVVPLLFLAAGLVAVSVVDLEHLRIPDRITFPTLGLVGLGIVGASLEQGVAGAISGAVVGAIAYFLLLLLAHLVSPRGMGFGDVKLALLLGAALGWLGWSEAEPVLGPLGLVLDALVAGCVLGVVFGVGDRLVTKRTDGFPFGPSLAIACLGVLLLVA